MAEDYLRQLSTSVQADPRLAAGRGDLFSAAAQVTQELMYSRVATRPEGSL